MGGCMSLSCTVKGGPKQGSVKGPINTNRDAVQDGLLVSAVFEPVLWASF